MNLDGHKLHLHPDRVAAWLSGQTVYPIYAEVSPTAACNHACTFCAFDFADRSGRMDADVLSRCLRELHFLGLKSVMFAGEGEPLLHPDIVEMVQTAHAIGLDVAMTTNASLLDEDTAKAILPHLTWLKASVDAGTRGTHSAIHGGGSFDAVVDNLRLAASLKTDCTLGYQMLLLPENAHEVFRAASLARDIGMDYFVLKPYSQHPATVSRAYADIEYRDLAASVAGVENLAREGFAVSVRADSMRSWDAQERCECRALPFWTYIATNGDVWACSARMDDPSFVLGNIATSSFRDIWRSPEVDVSACRVNCRMAKVNRYLDRLVNRHPHDNFL